MGEGTIKGKSMENIPIDLKMQAGEGITKLLLSVRRAVNAGNQVVFGSNDGHYIQNKKTGAKSKIIDKDGVYRYQFWRKKTNDEKKKGKAQVNAMQTTTTTTTKKVCFP